jgi:hypothetical protein
MHNTRSKVGSHETFDGKMNGGGGGGYLWSKLIEWLRALAIAEPQLWSPSTTTTGAAAGEGWFEGCVVDAWLSIHEPEEEGENRNVTGDHNHHHRRRSGQSRKKTQHRRPQTMLLLKMDNHPNPQLHLAGDT